MCKDNSITTSWSWVSMLTVAFFVAGGFIATSLGVHLTWGGVVIILFILTFFLKKKRCYCFSDSGFTAQWMLRKHVISAEAIKQIDVIETKSGTWIVVELNGTPTIASSANRTTILSYCIRYHCETFLIQLQRGERDKALELLQRCFPKKVSMTF